MNKIHKSKVECYGAIIEMCTMYSLLNRHVYVYRENQQMLQTELWVV